MEKSQEALLAELQAALPADWLAPHWPEYLALMEKLTYSLIQMKAGEKGWPKRLETESEFAEFFAQEAERLGHSAEEIKGFFAQAAAQEARQRIFEAHYAQLVPRDEQGRSLIEHKRLARFVGGRG